MVLIIAARDIIQHFILQHNQQYKLYRLQAFKFKNIMGEVLTRG